ncbi:MAG TPA: F0F1 ATP synthase subunit A [Chitinophagaceae bacterium]|nr:F0F1 ATP synthase subunit A [Chitinophagaceae bacterium]
MALSRSKSLLVAVFSLFTVSFFNPAIAGGGGPDSTHKKEAFNAKEIIFGHVLDAKEFHFFDIEGKDGKHHPVSIPLPVILYSPQRGLDFFMSSKFEHGHESHKGYVILNEENIVRMKLDPKKYGIQQIVAVNGKGEIDNSVEVYDLSLTRNVVQMLLALFIFTWIMLKIARMYKKGQGVITAPKGAQGFFEPLIVFIKDDVAKPNLGHNYAKYLPYLLTVFFFILINNVFGLIPGTANVTGNIAFTIVLGLISFAVILASSNKHYWGHIFNPPGMPLWVKFILVPVEFVSVFVKPMALIIRLFANMIAGHIIIICLVSLIFIFSAMNKTIGIAASPVAIGFTIFIYFIEILVAFLQAYIFTMLTAVFIGQAREGSHSHQEGDKHTAADYDDAVMV